MVPPQVPGGGTVRQTIFNDQADGCRNHTVGVAAPRQGQVQHVGVKILFAARAEMLRILDVDIDWPFRPRIPQIVKDSSHALVAVRTVGAVWAGSALVISTALKALGLGKILNTFNSFGPIRSIFPRDGHLMILHAGVNFFPEWRNRPKQLLA